MTRKLHIHRAIRAGVAAGALIAATLPAHAGDEGRSLSHLGWAWNWASGKTNVDGTVRNQFGGGLQKADNWETKVGGENGPGGWQQTKTTVALDKGYNTVKDSISAVVEWGVAKIATRVVGEKAGAVVGATVASGVVTLGETSADGDMGKKVDVLGSTIGDAGAAGFSEVANQAIPGGQKGRELGKVAVKTVVKIATDTIILQDAGKDPTDKIVGDAQTGLIDAGLAVIGLNGPKRDIAKGFVDGMIKDGTANGPQIGGGGIGGAGGNVGLPSGTSGGGGYTPSDDMNHSPGGGAGLDQSQDGPVGPKEDTHGAGGSKSDDTGGSGDDKNSSDAEQPTETFAKVEDLQTPGSMIDYGGMSNPEDGSGNSGKHGAQMEQLGIHIGGWGRNDGDQTYGSQNSNSDTTNHAGNHAGGGGNLFEPDYESNGGMGQTGAHQGSRGEGMGDGNASESGAGAGDGGGIRSHSAIGSGYSGNTSDGSGWGGLDTLPMAQDAPVTGQMGQTGMTGITGLSTVKIGG